MDPRTVAKEAELKQPADYAHGGRDAAAVRSLELMNESWPGPTARKRHQGASQGGHGSNTQTKFESLLNDLSWSADHHPNACSDAWLCPKCKGDPEDPILTDCLHIYCMECFTKILLKTRLQTSVTFVQCLATSAHRIRDCIELDNHQQDAIQEVIGGRKRVQYAATRSSSKSMTERVQMQYTSLTGDVEKLWDALDWSKSSTNTEYTSAREADDGNSQGKEDVDDPVYGTDAESWHEDDRSVGYQEDSFVDDSPQVEPESENEDSHDAQGGQDEEFQDEELQDEELKDLLEAGCNI